MNKEKGMIFKINYLHMIVLFVVMVVVCLIAFRYLGYQGLLVCLGRPIFLTLVLMFGYLSITVSQRGITGKYLFKSWNFAWQEITGWNPLELEKGQTMIFFRTGANVYKIGHNVLLFNKQKTKNLIAYFEKHCGPPLKDEARIRPTWS